jgi:mono/diheme cytochrome c family protein
MKKIQYLTIGLVLIAVGIIGLITVKRLFTSNFDRGMNTGMMWMMGNMMNNMGKISKKTEFSSNGERIFYTGVNSKGEAIINSHGMQGAGCAMCHGADAKGMGMMMNVPSLRWESLSDPEGHVHPGGRKHPPYTEPSFKVCVLAGVDPGGNQLSGMMPRWQMSNEDLDNLTAYLKTKDVNL